jgi:hypothetical protein
MYGSCEEKRACLHCRPLSVQWISELMGLLLRLVIVQSISSHEVDI